MHAPNPNFPFPCSCGCDLSAQHESAYTPSSVGDTAMELCEIVANISIANLLFLYVLLNVEKSICDQRINENLSEQDCTSILSILISY